MEKGTVSELPCSLRRAADHVVGSPGVDPVLRSRIFPVLRHRHIGNIDRGDVFGSSGSIVKATASRARRTRSVQESARARSGPSARDGRGVHPAVMSQCFGSESEGSWRFRRPLVAACGQGQQGSSRYSIDTLLTVLSLRISRLRQSSVTVPMRAAQSSGRWVEVPRFPRYRPCRTAHRHCRSRD